MHLSAGRVVLAIVAVSCSFANGYAYADSLNSEKKYHLSDSWQAGEVRQVKVSLTVEGNLKFKAASNNVLDLPLSVAGNLVYDERWISTVGNKTLRYYQEAGAKIRVGQREAAPFVRQSRRLVAHQDNEFYSPWGPFTREELDIVQVQANSALLGVLLPKDAVKIEEIWRPESEPLADILRLDAVSESKVECKLVKVSAGNAFVQVKGKVDGIAGGVTSTIDLEGQLIHDLSEDFVKHLSLEIKEVRAIAHVAPGLDVIAKLNVTIAPASESSQLTEAAVERLASKDVPASRYLAFRSEAGGFELMHDRKWHLMADLTDTTIFRRVDHGSLVGQCNISRLENRGDEALALEDFQANVQRVLGKHLGQLKEARESTTNTGLRILRLTAEGAVSELPIQWIYYHVENEQGECVSLVFTMEADVAEQFADSDRVMVTSLKIDGTRAPQRPIPAQAKAN